MSCGATTRITFPSCRPITYVRRVLLTDGLGRPATWAQLEEQAGRRGALLVFAGVRWGWQ